VEVKADKTAKKIL